MRNPLSHKRGEPLNQEEMKQVAAEKALEYIKNNMILGLGTGSTVNYLLQALSTRIRTEPLTIQAIPTSHQTKKIMKQTGIPITTLKDHPTIDLTIDGADEVDSDLNLIKGAGGALTREKIIAYHSKELLIIVDDSKVVKSLGMNNPIPVEVLQFAYTATQHCLEELGCTTTLRTIVNEPYITDNGNYIIDCEFPRIPEPEALEMQINMIPGVVENGLFINMADRVIVGGKQGIHTLEKAIIQ